MAQELNQIWKGSTPLLLLLYFIKPDTPRDLPDAPSLEEVLVPPYMPPGLVFVILAAIQVHNYIFQSCC